MVDHELAGDLAGRMPAHAVGDDEHVRPRVGGVLAVAADETAVGEYGVIQSETHGTNLTVVRLTLMSVPVPTRSGWSMRYPPT